MIKLKRALVSVSDKTNLKQLSELLQVFKVEVISTGGTYRELQQHLGADYPLLQDISAVTQFPEVLDGRVKTLHPAVHAGILARKDNAADLATLAEHNFAPFDLIVLNLYPFEQQLAKLQGPADEAQLAEMVELIDIGGITLLRASAKNYQHLALITDPADYEALADELEQNDGGISPAFTRQRMAAAFALSSDYDAAISKYFSENLKG